MTGYAPNVPTRECACVWDAGWEGGTWVCGDCESGWPSRNAAVNCCGHRNPLPCPHCDGTGDVLALRVGDVLCAVCVGTGTCHEPGRPREVTCPVCEGTGLLEEAPTS